MKIRIAFLFLSLVLVLTGCMSRPVAGQLLIAPILDRIVPADFRGDGEFAECGQYLTIEVRAGDLHKGAAGWTWTWLEYRRTINVPLVPGVPYRQEGWVKLGAPKEGGK